MQMLKVVDASHTVLKALLLCHYVHRKNKIQQVSQLQRSLSAEKIPAELEVQSRGLPNVYPSVVHMARTAWVPNESTWSKKLYIYQIQLVVFEIFKIAQETKKLAHWASKQASGWGYTIGTLGWLGVPNRSTWSKKLHIHQIQYLVGFEIFKITQETKKLASRVPKWASPRGTLQVPRGAQGVPRDVNHGSGRQKKNIHFQIFIKLCINFDLRH